MKDHENCGVGALTLHRIGRAVMANTFFHLTTLAALAVLAVLVAGLWAMSREGTASLSQKLMRWRVGLQFVAILAIIAYFLLSR